MELPPVAADVFEYVRQSNELTAERGISREQADDEIRRRDNLTWLRFRAVLLAYLGRSDLW